jgi:putative redox protein
MNIINLKNFIQIKKTNLFFYKNIYISKKYFSSKENQWIIVEETLQSTYQNKIKAKNHIIISDEPKESKGEDTGPAPYDLLLGALGSCTSMTLRMYANLKQLPLDKVTVKLLHERVIHPNNNQLTDKIIRLIKLEGSQLTLEQKQKLIEIANKCPVHRTLTQEKIVQTQLDLD